MDRNRIRSVFQEQFYRSLDEGGVELQAIPHSQLQALSAAFADAVFSTLVALDEDSDTPPSGTRPADEPEASEEAETLIWTGKPYLTLGTRYELTSQRLRIFRGIFSRQLEEIDLVRVRDTRVKQHLGERALNVGDVTILSTDPSNPEVVLDNIKDPLQVREVVREAYLKEQKRRGLRYREEG